MPNHTLQDLPPTSSASYNSGRSQESERLEAVKIALQGLDPADRSLLIMALEEIPRKEMAEILGIPETNLHTRLHRARKRLTSELERILE
jgi:RNA polymerase sigma factor (sigma-70 family)